MKFKLSGCLAAISSFLLMAAVASAALPALHTSGNKIYDASGNVVILRGVSVIDLGALQNWEGGVTAAIDRLTNTSDTSGSSPGFYTRVVRLPIVPTGYGSPWTWYSGDGDNYYNNLLRPVVNYCATKGIYCIIDVHYVEDITSSNASYTSSFWTYMAPRFKNDTNVIFELYNEPVNNGNGSDAANWNVVKGYMQSWYNIVRNAGATNLVVVGSPNYSSAPGTASSSQLSGNNIAYTCHLYPQHWTSSWNVNQLNTAAAAVPVFMTEWGFGNYPGNTLYNSTITAYGRPLMNQANTLGISWTAWVADTSWQPAMYNSSWGLLVGENQMGGFVKDTLYSLRNSNQPGSGSSSSQPIANGTYRIMNRNSGKALDATGNATANGTQIEQWTYGGGNNQRWVVTNLTGSQYKILGVQSGRALDVYNSGTANGTKIELWDYNAGNSQKWTFTGTDSGNYRLTPASATGSCLDVSAASAADGALVQLWTYGGGSNQQWWFSAP